MASDPVSGYLGATANGVYEGPDTAGGYSSRTGDSGAEKAAKELYDAKK